MKLLLDEANKEPWELTKKEYQKSELGRKYKDFIGRDQIVSGTDAERRVQGYIHKEHIVQAIARGEKIPKKVLKDYPDLMKQQESIVEKIALFLEQGTCTADIDTTPTADKPKKKKKPFRRSLQLLGKML